MPVDDLYRSSIVVDSMNNAGMTGDYLRTVRDAGITAAMVPVSISDPFGQAVERVLDLTETVEANSDVARIVRTVADIYAAKRDNQVGLILAVEDSRPLDKDLRKVALFHDIGVRRMQLVYTSLNDAGSGGGDRVDVGLSTFGTELVARLQDQGVLLDLCHASPATLRDAVRLATRPAIWSHTNAHAVFGHRNNLTDAELDLVAGNGGVVGVSGIPFYIGPPGAELSAMLDHVDHIVSRIGVRHVGIGLAIFENHPPSFYRRFASLPEDVYGTPPWTWPKGISTIAEYPNLAAALADRGYGDDEVRAILGGNHLRVLAAAWA